MRSGAGEAVDTDNDALERLRERMGISPESRELHLRLFEHAERSGVDRLVMLLDVLETEQGHRRSRETQRALDAQGRPLPWFTYPAIEYLDHLDLSRCRVLETGAGQGTLYWAQRVAEVVSVEDDPAWAERVRPALPANSKLIVADSDDAYVRAVSEAEGRFEIVVIDGKRRRRCAEAALPKLSDDGVTILDNAEWHTQTARLLRDAGLIEVDFHGFGPVVDFRWTTSLFLKPGFAPRPKAATHPPVVLGAQANEQGDG